MKQQLSKQNTSLVFPVSILCDFLFHYTMTNMSFHNNMTDKGAILQH